MKSLVDAVQRAFRPTPLAPQPSAEPATSYQGSVHDPLLSVNGSVAQTRRKTYVSLFEITGVPVDGMSPEDTEAFMSHWAGCLNTLRHKHGVQFVAHNRPGGLTPYVEARRANLARHSTQLHIVGRGIGSPLALLERDQIEHLARIDEEGGATSLSFYLVIDAPSLSELRSRGEWAASWLNQARLGGRVLKDAELADALSWYLRGETATHWSFTANEHVLLVHPEETYVGATVAAGRSGRLARTP